MLGLEFYDGREQTLVKHKILELYLQRFALIVGSVWDALTYVDCFAGPWNSQSENFDDSSFSIALRKLREAREEHEKRGRSIKLRCLFLERDPAAYHKLRQFASNITDADVT